VKAVEDGLFIRRDFPGGQMSRDIRFLWMTIGKRTIFIRLKKNLTLHIAELSDDYQQYTGRYVRVSPRGHNEAPALFKKEGIYYMITSGCTGWAPNEARMFTASSIWGRDATPQPLCRGRR
jgi:hypothetical protein